MALQAALPDLSVANYLWSLAALKCRSRVSRLHNRMRSWVLFTRVRILRTECARLLNGDLVHRDSTVYLIVLGIVSGMLCSCTPSKKTLEKQLPGTYRFEADNLRHGNDVLILNPDHTYVHLYTPLQSQVQERQTNSWLLDEYQEVILYGFVPWELAEWGGRRSDAEFRNPPPSNTGFPIKKKGNRIMLLINPDEGDAFVQQ